jgi:hypothetical protein
MTLLPREVLVVERQADWEAEVKFGKAVLFHPPLEGAGRLAFAERMQDGVG